ncbi:hypothetical protein [Phenylobacterium sp.]|uniref:hypothetical protein n=1 Tax=Phenylobacterium sp. TaxID=1871053 RepID=UPI002734CBB0|nr:hypothetical protein [Phenylobacterium sp.]MDP3855601.1 hypothetical protein [Phenylobacterium sp.]
MKTFLAIAAVAFGLAIAGAATAEPATITKDFGCSGFVPNPDGSPASFLGTTESHSVVTSSGVTSLVCKFDIPDGAEPAKATQGNDFLCNTYLGLTTDSKMVASPGGNATLTCRINGQP